MKILAHIILAGLIFILSPEDLFSGDKIRRPTVSSPLVVNAQRILQGFNMRVWLGNQMAMGIEAWDGWEPDLIGLEYPAGSGIDHLYGAGVWLGAKIGGVPRVDEGWSGYDARKEFLPGVNDHFWRTSVRSVSSDSLGYSGYYYNQSIIVNRAGEDDDGDGLTDEDELDGVDNDGDWSPLTDDVGSDGLPDLIEVSCDGVPYDAIANPDPAMDNYDPAQIDRCRPGPDGNYQRKNDRQAYTEANGFPDHGEPHVDEDNAALSDNDVYYAATDTFHTPVIPGQVPMGAKVWQKSYAWQQASSADAITVLEYNFLNVGHNVWDSIFVGMFADMDVGPTTVPEYYNHNYAAYDSLTHTAYIHNPVDTGTTPLGVTVLYSPKPFSSLRFIFQAPSWEQSPGTADSVLYAWMSGNAFPDSMIAPNQDPSQLSDARVFVSFGPFDQVPPGGEMKAVFALVSGETIEEMLLNARKAERIYAAGGFICPIARIDEPGGGSPPTVSWDPVQSPFGQVASYRVHYGSNPGEYSDSVETTGLSASIPGLVDTQRYYLSVAAIDDKGNKGALSDEISTIPTAPRGFAVTGEQRSVVLRWHRNANLDLEGYNVYRRIDQDTAQVKLNTVPLPDTMFVDTAVWGNHEYFYRITAIDHSGFESPQSIERSGRLIPPDVPANFVIGPGTDYLSLDWDQNTEADFAGYNIYRIDQGDTVKINNGLLPVPGFRDTSIVVGAGYSYYL